MTGHFPPGVRPAVTPSACEGLTRMIFESRNVRATSDDQIVTLWLDAAGQRGNALTPSVLVDLESALDAIQRLGGTDVVLLRSAKPDEFLGDADPNQTGEWSAEEAADWSARGQAFCERIADLSPGLITVALIDGRCAGAGLELALACDYRMAVERPSTLFVMPQVARGECPAWGGSVRLPRLVGPSRSLRLLAFGESIGARRAREWGLVDHAFPPKPAKVEIRSFLDRLQDDPRQPARWKAWLANNVISRKSAVARARQALADTPEDERPAAHRVVSAVEAGFSTPAEGFAAERRAAAELATSPARTHTLGLIRAAAAPAKIFPEPINPTPDLPARVGVVGGGELGANLAVWLALRGREVVLQECGDQALSAADRRIDRAFGERIAPGRIGTADARTADALIRRTVTWNGFEDCGWVIEAVDEDLGVKRAAFHELERIVLPRVPLTTAASAVRVESLQAELGRPNRVAGVHFLAPAGTNPVVELVRAPATDPDTLAALDAWLRELGRTPVLVSDRPGRVVLRLLLAYFSEAVFLVAEGLPADGIDRAMRRFGMTTGPLEWIDAIGFTRLAGLIDDMHMARGDRFATNLSLDALREGGLDGRPNGEGFYRHDGDRKRPHDLARALLWRSVEDPEVIGQYVFDPDEALRSAESRLVLRTINEAAALLGEEQSATPATIDLAMAHGAGWAPHLGGPLRHADDLGLGTILESLTRLADRFGPRFAPCLELQRRADAGETFYGTLTTGEAGRLARAA